MRDPVIFFFQAEDGIRDIGVTGVQTCALPISKAFQVDAIVNNTDFFRGQLEPTRHQVTKITAGRAEKGNVERAFRQRSEERRVGKEGRSRRPPDHEEKTKRTTK